MSLLNRWQGSRQNIHDAEQDRRDKLEANENKRLRRELDRQRSSSSTRQLTGKVVRGLGRGMHDIAESMNTPETNRRPRIAQMPRYGADISQGVDLDYLKHPMLRGRDIRGRKRGE